MCLESGHGVLRQESNQAVDTLRQLVTQYVLSKF
jgi:hypothetical protein